MDDFQIEPGGLHGFASRCRADAFDRCHIMSGDIGRLRQASPAGFSVHMDRAGAALANPAPKLGAGHPEDIAKNPEDRHVIRHVH
ncbi:hypothetical protein HYPGJ_20616 [Hyphomicrobium sp. GJ21]|nr:hypothetical protein HYPGJ_20616 [Hyphomicrobium sp. GJ21]